MTTNQAKKDLAAKLSQHNQSCGKLTAQSVDFSDLARDRPVFVTVHNGKLSRKAAGEIKAAIPKPSEGGYCVQFNNCEWRE